MGVTFDVGLEGFLVDGVLLAGECAFAYNEVVLSLEHTSVSHGEGSTHAGVGRVPAAGARIFFLFCCHGVKISFNSQG